MTPEPSPSSEDFALLIQSAAVVGIKSGNPTALSEIIDRSFAHIQTSKLKKTFHTIGEQKLFWADYQLVCAWAEELQLTDDDVLDRLLKSKPDTSDPDASTWWDSTTLVDGRFKILFVDRKELPVSTFPSIDGLSFEKLKIQESSVSIIEKILTMGSISREHALSPQSRPTSGFTELNLTSVPSLEVLDCSGIDLIDLHLGSTPNLNILDCSLNGLTVLDLQSAPSLTNLKCNDNYLDDLNLTGFPNLKILDCSRNQLANLDLSSVPNLRGLVCSKNRLSNLDLSLIPNLIGLACFWNQLTSLDFTSVPNLKILDCSRNGLTDINLVPIPELTRLHCADNNLSELDIRPLKVLQKLMHSGQNLRIIQRPDQNFE